MNRKHIEHMKKQKESLEETYESMDISDVSGEFHNAVSKYCGTGMKTESALHREILPAM